MNSYDIILIGIFLTWILATILKQFTGSKLSKKVNAIDQLGLVPLWTFFAPNPGTNDYHLLYREELENGNRSSWNEIAINSNRKLINSIWNPDKRGKKVLYDIAQSLIPVSHAYRDKPHMIVVSIPYILILNAIMREPSLSQNCQKKQFMLTSTKGYASTDTPEIVMMSEFHPIHAN